MRRKILAMLLCVCMGAGLAGCGGGVPVATEKPLAESAQEANEDAEASAGAEEPPTEAPSDAASDETQVQSLMGYNMIEHGDFAGEKGPWGIYCNGGSATMFLNDAEQLEVEITDVGSLDYGAQIYYDGFGLDTGCVYKLSFDAASTVERDLAYRIQVNGGDYHSYTDADIHFTPEMQHFEFEFTMTEGGDPAPRLCFNMGLFETNDSLGVHNVTFDNFELYCIDESNRIMPEGPVETPIIQVNQIGYRPDDAKLAVVRGSKQADVSGPFAVQDIGSGSTIFDGQLSQAIENGNTGEWEAIADFSDLKTPGKYKVYAGKTDKEQEGVSYEFEIGENVYAQAFDAAVKMLYLQRCGMELTEEYAGEFKHPVCHSDKAVIFGDDSGKTVDVSGGWHDAGDYGRYVVPGAKAVADILLAYERYPEAFGDAAGIPESGNGIPDILDEAKYELDWMLKMQDAKSGGVYHKVTCANFPEAVMPEGETEQLILSPISNCATGDFAAVMAMAARVYKEIDGKYADDCLKAAKKAMGYLETHENGDGFMNPGDIVTGEYGDKRDADERFWANAELFKTTGEAAYEEGVAQTSFITVPFGFGWAGVGLYGCYAYLTSNYTDAECAAKVLGKMEETAVSVVNAAKADSYRSTIGSAYPWGSNMNIANNGMLLLMLDDLHGKSEHRELAKAQLDYLFGNNTNSYCFLTGFGTLSAQFPHHRPSQALNKPMPGMLIGGPDSALEDPYAKAVLKDVAPAKCYVDNAQSFSCNEITIYWNSPLIYLMSAFEK